MNVWKHLHGYVRAETVPADRACEGDQSFDQPT